MNTGYVEVTGFEHFVQTLRGWALAGDQYIFLAFTTIAAPKQNTPAATSQGYEFKMTLTKIIGNVMIVLMAGREVDGSQLYNSLHCFVTKHYYFRSMSKITIDTKKWATAKTLAKEQGWDNKENYTQRVTTIVGRYGVKTWTIEELGIRLIDRDQFKKAIPK